MATSGRVTAEERVYVAIAGLCALSGNPADAAGVQRIVGGLTIDQVRETFKGLKKKRLIVAAPGGFEPAAQDDCLSLTAIPGRRYKIETDEGLLEVSHAQLGVMRRLLQGFSLPLGAEA